jgi:hypothetical protein
MMTYFLYTLAADVIEQNSNSYLCSVTAVNARHLATRRAHPAFKFFTSLIPEAESFNLESFVPATTGGLEEHMLPPQMSG